MSAERLRSYVTASLAVVADVTFCEFAVCAAAERDTGLLGLLLPGNSQGGGHHV
jgi:hypothetical protein